MVSAPRVATKNDVNEILRLGELMYASVGIEVEDAWRELGRSQFEARLGANLLGWVVDDEDSQGCLSACGFVNRTPRLPLPEARSAERGYVQWVVTDPAHQRRGLARRIMDAIMQWAIVEDIDVLDLHSSSAARPLYLALGFRFSPDISYPLEVFGAPMQWRAGRTDPGSARPS